MNSNPKTCCFFGHRKISDTPQLKTHLKEIIEDLIQNKNVTTFLFGSKSDFNKLCLKTVSELKLQYPHIRRIYVRAEYPVITDSYKSYLLESYEDTYYPESALNAGKSAYIKRNQEMINNADFCVVYYNKSYEPPKRKYSKHDQTEYQPKSGTQIAYEYAMKKNKEIIQTAEV